ncbi:hypothetical protein CEXT_526171 [Caerostris extrusa]|uniref:Uncharacterized protein n=1 Tax=Caerostris extrusa TaxID=172846 RepID=A0AAV4PCF4_CAEEX|nr:hypothetical protein CEXT_526171 [Caerostris extrusa]
MFASHQAGCCEAQRMRRLNSWSTCSCHTLPRLSAWGQCHVHSAGRGGNSLRVCAGPPWWLSDGSVKRCYRELLVGGGMDGVSTPFPKVLCDVFGNGLSSGRFKSEFMLHGMVVLA